MRILIDGDGCPVVGETLKVASEYNVECILVCDTAHVFSKYQVETVIVSQGADSADFALVNQVSPGDVVITQDYGLAALCLAKRAFPLNQNGILFTNENIDGFLMARHTAKKIRNAGGRLKGPSKRTSEQDRTFCEALRSLLDQLSK